MTDPRRNELAVTDASGFPRTFYMGHLDREPVEIDAEQAIISATAQMSQIASSGTATLVTGPIEQVNASGTKATVIINADPVIGTKLVRGGIYEVAVTMVNAAGRKWTRTLPIIVRA